MAKPTHFSDAGDLYKALSKVLDPERYDLRALWHYLPESYGIEVDQATRAVLAEFLAWLGQTRGGHGLTAESCADFEARTKLGVRVTVDGNGALVVRVPSTALRDDSGGEA